MPHWVECCIAAAGVIVYAMFQSLYIGRPPWWPKRRTE